MPRGEQGRAPKGTPSARPPADGRPRTAGSPSEEMYPAAMQYLAQALMITAFVGVMMVVIEYVNVQTRGASERLLRGGPWRQLLLGSLLGATPGCLGAYMVVTLYAHGNVSLGAVVAAMIATSGDESFVMFAQFPGTALALTLGLAVLGVLAGWGTDRLIPARWAADALDECQLELHDTPSCRCYPRGEVLRQWRRPSLARVTLSLALVSLLVAMSAGWIGPLGWDWKRVTLMLVMGIGLFVVSTVPDHFLRHHLWRHVVVQHVPRIFAWTLGVLLAIGLLSQHVDLHAWVQGSPWVVLLLAALVGIIPESGPHLIFVMLYAQGTLPLSVLAASSAVQDGHGMLPLLALSKRSFFLVKLINVAVGLGVGALLLAAGS